MAPILASRCLDCHGGATPKGGLDLSRPDGVLKGGESGAAVVAGKLEESPLWQRVEADEMPPKRPLPAVEKATLRRWLEGGASWGTAPIDRFAYSTETRAGRDWWSLGPIRRPEPPDVRDASWPRNPIDRFVLARLEAKGLEPSREADRHTLARRLSFDLLGLPPDDDSVRTFVRQPESSAYEAMVDRLLASPHLGERWARHWLDVIRYGESDGFERNTPRRSSWPYRDWVIRALNADLPYDRFCRLQLAGDLLDAGNPDSVAATGFLVAGIHNTVVAQNDMARQIARQDELEDLIGSVGQTFLGLTVNCGRCHDHKFDPVDQRDYYRLASALSGVQHGERELRLSGRGATKVYTCLAQQPAPTRLLKRGQVTTPAEPVAPGAIQSVAFAGPAADFGMPADAPEGERRRRLAEWVAHPANPLFARVIVNRLWHHHFGVGLVETPNDFGFNGGRPSHPELLDWLAAELIARGFRLKEIHRLIVTSATYRQARRRGRGPDGRRGQPAALAEAAAPPGGRSPARRDARRGGIAEHRNGRTRLLRLSRDRRQRDRLLRSHRPRGAAVPSPERLPVHAQGGQPGTARQLRLPRPGGRGATAQCHDDTHPGPLALERRLHAPVGGRPGGAGRPGGPGRRRRETGDPGLSTVVPARSPPP
ncbi:MAG: PSD1 and planctomycete cytochrome C domain-containing protein [Isosphaeraceae bacterium]